MYEILKAGGFTTGGLNFDAKVRRQSTDKYDLFYGHIGAMDTMALSLKVAARMIEDGELDKRVARRYAGWNGELGQQILNGQMTLSDIAQYAAQHQLAPQHRSGQQEQLENWSTIICLTSNHAAAPGVTGAATRCSVRATLSRGARLRRGSMYIGIDLGTSGVKAILLNEQGEVVASHTEKLTVSRPHPLWSEQDPEQWWLATDTAMKATGAQHSLRDVKALGIAGQMHGATLLDKSLQVLRPAILWNDGRCAEECQLLEDKVSASRQITGNLMMPGFTAPKLLWVQRHEAAVFSQSIKCCCPRIICACA